MTSGVPARTAAVNGSRSVPSSSAREAGMVTEVSSVFSVARPRPGKCLAVAPTRSRPWARVDAAVSSATSRPPPGNARPATTEPSESATSPTGARFTFTPPARSPRAASRAEAVTASTDPCRPCEASGGENGRVRMSPPSWSVITRAAPAAARWRLAVSERSEAASGAFLANRITPVPSPLRRRRTM